MPAYNAAPFILQAIDSVLQQSFTDFELIVINDGSTDNTGALVAALDDPRIRLVHNDGNRGLIYTRNLGVELARGEFIAYLDSDDAAFPQRMEKQLTYLQRRPDLVAVGAWAQPMDAQGHYRNFFWRYPGNSEFVKATLLFRAYINTSTFFIRADVMKQLKFSPHHELGEDYDLYMRCVKRYKVENIPEVLIAFRLHATSITKTKVDLLAKNLNEISVRALNDLGLAPTPEEIALHRYIEWLGSSDDPQIFEKTNAWLNKILAANARSAQYDAAALRHAVAERWFAVCYANTHFGWRALMAFRRGPLAAGGMVTATQYAKFFIKSLARTVRPT